jgi:hypothetical protein
MIDQTTKAAAGAKIDVSIRKPSLVFIQGRVRQLY